MGFPLFPRLNELRSFSFWLWVCMIGLLWLAAAGCAKKNDHQLVVGMELSYPPFEMTDEHNEPSGIEVEMARALADSLHKTLVIQNTKFAGLIPALQTGKVDLVISSMTATAERAEAIDFSDPYMHTAICLLVGKNSDVLSGSDLNRVGRRVVVKTGTTGSTFAREHFARAQVFQIADEAACVLEIVQGKTDAFIYDQMSVYQLQKKNPETTRALLKPLQRESWAVGIRKGNKSLRDEVNGFLADYRAKHGLEKLADKYLNDKKALEEMGQPFSY